MTVALHRINGVTVLTEYIGKGHDGRKVYRTFIVGGVRGGEAKKSYDLPAAREHHARVVRELMGASDEG